MTDEEMISCLGNATICVFAADYAEVSIVSFLNDVVQY